MEIIKTTKKKTTTEKITHQTSLGFDIIETITNGKHKGVALSCKDKGFHPVMLELPKDWVEKYTEFDDLFNYQIIPKKIEDIRETKIYFTYTSGLMLFNRNRQIVSIPHFFDYIGSLKEKEPRDSLYVKLIKLLKEHPYVLLLEEEEIPYYNRDFPGQYGIRTAKVQLPQNKYKRLCEKYKEEEFWSCRMTDDISMHHHCLGIYGDKIDALLKKYWKKETYSS